MARKNANALRTGLDIRDHRSRVHTPRVQHRHRCNCRPCKQRKLRQQGLFHLI